MGCRNGIRDGTALSFWGEGKARLIFAPGDSRGGHLVDRGM